MSERDWADDVIDERLGRFWSWNANGIPQEQRAVIKVILSEHHTSGLREGAAAERQRCAGVCDRLASQWESGEQNRPYLQGMIGAACICRDAILSDPGAGPVGDEAKAKRCPCGGEYRLLKKDHFPVPLSACIKCGVDGPPWPDVVGETPGAGPEKPTVAERVITRLDDFAKRLEDVPDDIRCENCGAPLDLLDTSWRSAGENLWEHRCPGAHPQAGSFRGVPAAQPHGPPVAADPGAEAQAEQDRRFVEFLEKAAEEVATWPEWKKNLLGQLQEPAADPGEGRCGTCALWHRPQGCDFGFCKVARTVTNRGPDCPGLGTLHQTTADRACDIGAWRAKENPAGG